MRRDMLVGVLVAGTHDGLCVPRTKVTHGGDRDPSRDDAELRRLSQAYARAAGRRPC
jgi:hypothetical protein